MPIELSSKDKILAAVAALTEALEGLSSREKRDALTMVSAVNGLRVIPLDRPIGNPDGRPRVKTVDNRPPTGKKNPSKSAWKESTEWREAIAKRKELVEAIKSLGDSPKPDPTSPQVVALRNHEEEMRTLKSRLRASGFGN